jgi:hypothetical protein
MTKIISSAPSHPDTSPQAIARVLRHASVLALRAADKSEGDGEAVAYYRAVADEYRALGTAVEKSQPIQEKDLLAENARLYDSLRTAGQLAEEARHEGERNCNALRARVTELERALADALDRQPAPMTWEDRLLAAELGYLYDTTGDHPRAIAAALRAGAPELAPSDDP